jgi:hypothetical protein
MPASPTMVLRPIPSVAMSGFAQAMASNATFGNLAHVGQREMGTRSLEMQAFSDRQAPGRPRSSRRLAAGHPNIWVEGLNTPR